MAIDNRMIVLNFKTARNILSVIYYFTEHFGRLFHVTFLYTDQSQNDYVRFN